MVTAATAELFLHSVVTQLTMLQLVSMMEIQAASMHMQ
jgi:hypothetical protein